MSSARRYLPILITAAVLVYVAIDLIAVWPVVGDFAGRDYALYMDVTRRWLAGGGFYEPYQLAGPYPITHGDVLYPPVALWLFVPFTAAPAVLWWAMPAVLVGWSLWRLRPAPAVWPVIALWLAWPPTLVKLLTGNPVIWAVAAMAVGVVVTGVAVFVLVKPSLAPFAAWGIGHRRWWLALALFVGLCVPFGPLWADWLVTVMNSQGGGILYSLQEFPMLLLPVVAWLGRTTLRDRSGDPEPREGEEGEHSEHRHGEHGPYVPGEP